MGGYSPRQSRLDCRQIEEPGEFKFEKKTGKLFKYNIGEIIYERCTMLKKNAVVMRH